MQHNIKYFNYMMFELNFVFNKLCIGVLRKKDVNDTIEPANATN